MVAYDFQRINHLLYFGRVQSVIGPLIEVGGLNQMATLGGQCCIHTRDHRQILSEIVGFRKNMCLVMPYENVEGIGPGCRVDFTSAESVIYPHKSWLGRILNAQGQCIDNGNALIYEQHSYPLKTSPPLAHTRRLVENRLDLGVKAINTFLTCCYGQRMGIFAASGIGKSVLLSQIARFTSADIVVIGLIGERGREVREFIEKHLGPEGLRKSVVIVATSDEPALMRRQAAYLTLAVAEYFRDQGAEVLCLMDSVTRFAMALREIGLAVGEPPASKGYTPSVFAELPRLLERAGPGKHETDQGNITGIFTVLVEGDDHDEPVADAVRGILDGHIILERAIAQRGRFPPINILRSISRTVPDCHSDAEQQIVTRARRLLSTYDDMAEMIRLGAYRKGSNPAVDEAINYYDALDAFLAQGKEEATTIDESFLELAAIIDGPGKA
jgi:flagellum-specific ATP synthase